jgi:hypothetical protein
MRLELIALLIASLPLAACSGSVDLATGGTTSGGEGGSGGSGGVGGSGGGTSTLCAHTTDAFSISLVPGGGAPNLDCSAASTDDMTPIVEHLEGVVISTGTNTLAVDTCPQGVTCDTSSVITLSVGAPGLAVNIQPGVLIQLDVAIVPNFWRCTQSIVARNLPTWDGLQSPLGGDPILFFAGAEGMFAANDAPFTVSATALGCYPMEPLGCVPRDEFRFDVTTTTADPIAVMEGETVHFPVPLGDTTQTVTFRNLRSFQTGNCDDYWDWAWWATGI